MIKPHSAFHISAYVNFKALCIEHIFILFLKKERMGKKYIDKYSEDSFIHSRVRGMILENVSHFFEQFIIMVGGMNPFNCR